MRPLAAAFGEIHGVDVSDEMIGRARELLRHTPNAHPHSTTGSDLALFPDGKFDFVYSYAVFQHIPSRDVVFHYLREAWRVLKPGGILRCQLNGLPQHAKQYDTWNGVRITPEEIHAFARAQNFHLLALEDIWTQYMWMTCRKPAAAPASTSAAPAIRRINNALTGEAVAPDAGYLAALSLLIAGLPPDCDLNNLSVSVDDLPCRVAYIGPPAADDVTQVNAILPPGIRTGLLPVTAAEAVPPEAACRPAKGWRMRRRHPHHPRRPRRAARGAGHRRRQPAARLAYFERHRQSPDAGPGPSGPVPRRGRRPSGARPRCLLHRSHPPDARIQFPSSRRHRAGNRTSCAFPWAAANSPPLSLEVL